MSLGMTIVLYVRILRILKKAIMKRINCFLLRSYLEPKTKLPEIMTLFVFRPEHSVMTFLGG